MTNEARPPTVPTSASRGGKADARWAWVEREAWSRRMLDALDNGVKGGRWFSLRDKVYAAGNLRASWTKVRENRGAAGIDGTSIARFAAQEERYLKQIEEELRTGSYEPEAVRRVYIPKPGTAKKRPLGIPTVKDRIVQTALRHVLEPIWEKQFLDQSYGFRPGRGCKDALRRVDELLRAGHLWVVDADIRSFFDTVDHGVLMSEVERSVSDGAVLELVRKFLTQRVMDEVRTWTPEEGMPQGATLSPLLANIYLHPVDQDLVAQGFEIVRYADDLVILCRCEADARRALACLERVISTQKLRLAPEKTNIADMAHGGAFEFLGYRFERGRRFIRRSSWHAFRDKVRALTPRLNGHSLATIIARLRPVLCGFFEYFKHCHARVLAAMDGWIRRRLRRILLKRHRKRGTGRGLAHQRWPNAFFAKHGLFTMTEAHAAALQSRKG